MTEKHTGMRIDIELGTKLLLEISGLEGKTKSKLVGQEPMEFLIVKAPIGQAGVRPKLHAGNKVTVRYLQHGNVYAFETSIIALIDKPKSLLFIDYPSKIAQVSLRKKERFDCYLPCIAKLENGDEKATILDFSLSGCRCLVQNLSHSGNDNLSAIGLNTVLRFESPADGKQILIKAQVTNMTADHSTAQLGLVYEGNSDEIVKRIENLVAFLSMH